MISDFEFLSDSNDVYQNDDFLQLTQAWVNEKGAPEILNYEHHLVQNLLEMIETQVSFFSIVHI